MRGSRPAKRIRRARDSRHSNPFSRFPGTVQQGPVQRQETQIVAVLYDFRRFPAVIQALGTPPTMLYSNRWVRSSGLTPITDHQHPRRQP